MQVSIHELDIKTLSKPIIEGLTMVVDDGGMIPDILNNYSVGGCTSGSYMSIFSYHTVTY